MTTDNKPLSIEEIWEGLQNQWGESGERLSFPKKLSIASDYYAKQMAIGFFRYNAEKIGEYLEYLKKASKIGRNLPYEKMMEEYEVGGIADRYEQYLKTL